MNPATTAPDCCRVIIDREPHAGSWNMAVDEALLEAAISLVGGEIPHQQDSVMRLPVLHERIDDCTRSLQTRISVPGSVDQLEQRRHLLYGLLGQRQCGLFGVLEVVVEGRRGCLRSACDLDDGDVEDAPLDQELCGRIEQTLASSECSRTQEPTALRDLPPRLLLLRVFAFALRR